MLIRHKIRTACQGLIAFPNFLLSPLKTHRVHNKSLSECLNSKAGLVGVLVNQAHLLALQTTEVYS